MEAAEIHNASGDQGAIEVYSRDYTLPVFQLQLYNGAGNARQLGKLGLGCNGNVCVPEQL